MADQLRQLNKDAVWSGSKLFQDTISDPVNTYDFDRAMLMQYIRADDPEKELSMPKVNVCRKPANIRWGKSSELFHKHYSERHVYSLFSLT